MVGCRVCWYIGKGSWKQPEGQGFKGAVGARNDRRVAVFISVQTGMIRQHGAKSLPVGASLRAVAIKKRAARFRCQAQLGLQLPRDDAPAQSGTLNDIEATQKILWGGQDRQVGAAGSCSQLCRTTAQRQQI